MNLSGVFILGWPDILAIFLMSYLGSRTSIWAIRWKDQRAKRKLMEDFIGGIQEKISTEEEFNAIINKMKNTNNSGVEGEGNVNGK